LFGEGEGGFSKFLVGGVFLKIKNVHIFLLLFVVEEVYLLEESEVFQR
jgi:hypothetical protein